MSFFSDEEKDVVSVDGTEVYAKSHEEDLTKEGGNGLMPSCVCSLKIHHKSLHKDIQAWHCFVTFDKNLPQISSSLQRQHIHNYLS